MRKTLSTRLAVLFGAGALLAACGDNIRPGGGDDDDGVTPDAEGPPPDADTRPTVGGTLAISDALVVDPEATAVGGIGGGSISLSVLDLRDDNGGVEVYRQTPGAPVGGCVVTQFDPTHLPNTLVDAGPVTIANEPADEASPTGLLKTVGPCVFVAAASQYMCISASSADAGGTETPQNVAALDPPDAAAPPGFIVYTFTDAATVGLLNSQKLIGSALQINGFAEPNTFLNSGPSAFPIVGQSGTVASASLTVVNPGGEALADSTTTPTPTGVYKVINGASPIPAAFQDPDGTGGPMPPVYVADFLGTGNIKVTKPATDVFEAIDFTIDVPGEGFALDDESTDPANFPLGTTAAADQRYECDGPDNMAGTDATDADNTCGSESDTSLTAIIITGRATKKDLTGLQAFQMPTEVPGTDTWLEWQCAFLIARSATMPQAAVEAIQNFEPTRVEQRVLFAAGTIVGADVDQVRVLAGHALVGHSDPPPAAK